VDPGIQLSFPGVALLSKGVVGSKGVSGWGHGVAC
jgi:hypothetical protein